MTDSDGELDNPQQLPLRPFLLLLLLAYFSLYFITWGIYGDPPCSTALLPMVVYVCMSFLQLLAYRNWLKFQMSQEPAKDPPV